MSPLYASGWQQPPAPDDRYGDDGYQDFAPTARSAPTERAATVGEHPASPRPNPAAALSPPGAAANPLPAGRAA